MAKSDNSKKKVIASSATATSMKKVTYSAGSASKSATLLYGRDFYIWMLIGVVFIAVGFALMAGGNQPPNEFNADEIYSFRRTGLAPIVILIGLGIEIYAIFKK